MERNGKKLNFSPLFANLHFDLEKNAGDELPPLSHLQPFQLQFIAQIVQVRRLPPGAAVRGWGEGQMTALGARTLLHD